MTLGTTTITKNYQTAREVDLKSIQRFHHYIVRSTVLKGTFFNCHT